MRHSTPPSALSSEASASSSIAVFFFSSYFEYDRAVSGGLDDSRPSRFERSQTETMKDTESPTSEHFIDIFCLFLDFSQLREHVGVGHRRCRRGRVFRKSSTISPLRFLMWQSYQSDDKKRTCMNSEKSSSDSRSSARVPLANTLPSLNKRTRSAFSRY